MSQLIENTALPSVMQDKLQSIRWRQAVLAIGRSMAIAGAVLIAGMILAMAVDWWFTLHQPASLKLTEPSTMHASMWQPLVVMIVGFYLLYATLLIQQVRVEILLRERRTRWVKELVQAAAARA